MAISLTPDATERSTYVLEISFLDEDGAAVTPSSATWTLTDPLGNVVNQRSQVTISPLGSTVTVVLKGDDLALEGYSSLTRHFTVEAVYTSTLGSDLPLKEAVTFEIEGLVAI